MPSPTPPLRRPHYPGIVGHYTDAAWWWAEMSTDGQITDSLLRGISVAHDLPYQLPAETREVAR